MKPEYSCKIPKNSITSMAVFGKKRLCVKEDGIHQVQDILDTENKIIGEIDNIVVPKEIFVEAYKKYIGKDLGE